jgi:adenine-specific DNA-methyltransferase
VKISITSFLKKYSTDPLSINRLLVSAYLTKNRLVVRRNEAIRKYVICENAADHPVFQKFLEILETFSLEDLIKCFEFVISPTEKIVTGAVYTPKHIRDYIVNRVLEQADITEGFRIADISCGCGGFLLDAAIFIQKAKGRTYRHIIETNLFGVDIASYSIERTKIVLSLLALQNKEDVNLQFNLFEANSLDFDWKRTGTFDVILGNPPYICSRNIDEASKALLSRWEVTRSGHPDLYIPFFQIALEALKEGGQLGYITVNTFFKSLNGRALRHYFSRKQYRFKIIDFRHEQVFKNKSTYTCICFIKKEPALHVQYTSSKNQQLAALDESCYAERSYLHLDHFSGWNFGRNKTIETINKIEAFETKLFSNFSFSTGIATLKNSVYKFKPVRSDAQYHYFLYKGELKKAEKKICRNIINSNKVTVEEDLAALKERIIFPYQWEQDLKKNVLINETHFAKEFPFAYQYLKDNKNTLSQRDNGDQENYEAWFAYGRTQALNTMGKKLLLPHITNKPVFVFSPDRKLLFYNGEAIVSESSWDLLVLKKILESDIFLFYVRHTSKPYSSGFFSLGKNYIKNFSIPSLLKEEEHFLLKTTDKNKILHLLLKKYRIKYRELIGL